MKSVYVSEIGNVLSLEKECVVSFRTLLPRNGKGLVLEYETESRDYNTSYRLKIKETHSTHLYKNDYFIQLRRM